MVIKSRPFGAISTGAEATLYSLVNGNGMQIDVTNYGAILVNVLLPDGKDGLVDVVCGYDSVEPYEVNPCFFGATIGRNGNRIGKARFTLNGKEYQLAANENGNNLHTDYDKGFHKIFWNAEPDENTNSVKFSYDSPEGDCGFPGELKVSVTYTLTDDNEIRLVYEGISDAPTVFNPTNHTYFNLKGHDNDSIMDVILTLDADRYTEIFPDAIPTGKLPSVEGTVMDFRKGLVIGEHIDDDWEQLTVVKGYDHNFALSHKSGNYDLVAVVEAPSVNRKMEVYTDRPGIQFYAGNCIAEHTGKAGAKYAPRCAMCLETQFYPDCVNQPAFESAVIEANTPAKTTTAYKFYW